MSTSKFKGGVGFRDLVVFNKALLAKQGCRILSNPDSLVAMILKEKYFPTEKFIEAKVGYRPSYAWRSICQTREVLKVGVGWRMGNGEILDFGVMLGSLPLTLVYYSFLNEECIPFDIGE
jgi:hypothetical protein